MVIISGLSPCTRYWIDVRAESPGRNTEYSDDIVCETLCDEEPGEGPPIADEPVYYHVPRAPTLISRTIDPIDDTQVLITAEAEEFPEIAGITYVWRLISAYKADLVPALPAPGTKTGPEDVPDDLPSTSSTVDEIIGHGLVHHVVVSQGSLTPRDISAEKRITISTFRGSTSHLYWGPTTPGVRGAESDWSDVLVVGPIGETALMTPAKPTLEYLERNTDIEDDDG